MTHFTYSGTFNGAELFQGDVLSRDSQMEEVLAPHPEFWADESIIGYMVLTQSCDLVRRKSKDCKAPYITLCAVRSLDRVLKDRVDGDLQSSKDYRLDIGVGIGTNQQKQVYADFLSRLFQNNEQAHFYLDKRDTPLASDACALLNLSVSVQRNKFEQCLVSKIIELNLCFQAKLGWLLGQIFSRVGTPDFPARELSDKRKQWMNSGVLWMEDERQIRAFADQLGRIAAEKPDEEITDVDIQRARSLVPTVKKDALQRIHKLLGDYMADAEAMKRLLRQIETDPNLSVLLKW